MAQSRSALERCIADFVLHGDFKSTRHRYAHEYSNDHLWKLDDPLDIESQTLEQEVTSWLRDFDSTAAKHESSLHAIINTLQKYVGDIEACRPKGLRDGTTGKRPQLAKVRHLPPRRKAIEHAWENGLITDEEYSAAPTEGDIAEQGEGEGRKQKFGFDKDAFLDFT